MPDRKKSTASKQPARDPISSKDLVFQKTPEVTDRSAFEAQCQREMMQYAGELSTVRSKLWTLHVTIGEQHRDEDMAEGTYPESLGYSMRGAVECACSDHLDPAIAALEKAARETPYDLVAEWCKRNDLLPPFPGTNAR